MDKETIKLNDYQILASEMKFRNPEVQDILIAMAGARSEMIRRGVGQAYQNMIMTLAEGYNDDKVQIFNFLSRDLAQESVKKLPIRDPVVFQKKGKDFTVVEGCEDCGDSSVQVQPGKPAKQKAPMIIEGETFRNADGYSDNVGSVDGDTVKLVADGQVIEIAKKVKAPLVLGDKLKVGLTAQDVGGIMDELNAEKELKDLDESIVGQSLQQHAENHGIGSEVIEQVTNWDVKESNLWADVYTYFEGNINLMVEYADKHSIDIDDKGSAKDISKELFGEFQLSK